MIIPITKLIKFICYQFFLLVAYKFSYFNNGIGRYDALPSIINADYKNNFNWQIDYDNKKCKNVENKIRNFSENKFQWLKYNFINIKFYKQNYLNFNSFDCYVQDSDDMLLIKQY